MKKDTKKPTVLWAVMKAYPFSALLIWDTVPVSSAPGEPQRFIPVFNTKEEALAWGGTEDNIFKLDC